MSSCLRLVEGCRHTMRRVTSESRPMGRQEPPTQDAQETLVSAGIGFLPVSGNPSRRSRVCLVLSDTTMAGEQIFNLKFVGAVEKRPELYNFNLPQYTRKDIVERGWNEVAKEMGNMSAAECKERWKNLRSVFVRNLKPTQGSKKKKPYYLTDAMRFTLPFVRINLPSTPGPGYAPPISELSQSQHEDEADDPEEIPIKCEQFLYEEPLHSPQSPQQPVMMDPLLQNSSTIHVVQPSLLSQDRIGQSQPPEPSLNKPDYKRGASANMDESFIEFFQTKKIKFVAPKEKDKKFAGIRSFLDSLIPELEPLTEDQLKQFRRRVFQLIDDIQSPQHFDSSASSSYSEKV